MDSLVMVLVAITLTSARLELTIVASIWNVLIMQGVMDVFALMVMSNTESIALILMTVTLCRTDVTLMQDVLITRGLMIVFVNLVGMEMGLNVLTLMNALIQVRGSWTSDLVLVSRSPDLWSTIRIIVIAH